MKVEVVPYRRSWADEYAVEQSLLLNSLGDNALEIFHIGSTSIKGLAAKPIIDILISINSLDKLDSLANAFESLGYEVMGEFGIQGRRYYRKGGDIRTHHVHAFKAGDQNIARHLAFRDYLRHHRKVMLEYQDLKIKLAAECNGDIDCYCEGKDKFIKHYEAKALKWYVAI